MMVLSSVHVIGSCLHGEEVTWTNNIINIVVSEIGLWQCGAVSSVGGAVVVNNIIIHILVLMDVFIIGEITISKFIGVSAELNEVGLLSELLLRLDSVVEVLIDNIVSWITLVLKILVIVVITVGDVITVSDTTLGVLGDILLEVVLIDFDSVVQIIIIHHSDGGISLEPLVDETGILNNIIVIIQFIENFLIIGFVSVGELIRLSLDFRLSLGVSGSLKPFVDESIVFNDIIITVINILNFFVIGLVTVGKFIGLSSQENEALWSLDSLKRMYFRS